MNCRDFDTVVNELADGRLMEAATREAGLHHAGECLSCAAHLMDVRGIGAALKVAARAETEEAPARVKQALLGAFAERLQESMEPAPTVEPTHAVIVLPSRRALRWWDAAAVAAAAAVLLILGATYLVRDSRRVSQAPPSETRAALHALAPAAPAAVEEKNADAAQREVAQAASTNSTKRAPAIARRAPALTNAEKNKTGTVARNMTRNITRSAGNEYLPLTYVAGATAMESGTVVRIKLSRSALISLGVPVSAERGDDLLKADVMIGDDGVARAIRLVGND
jgi:hypothetical protein